MQIDREKKRKVGEMKASRLRVNRLYGLQQSIVTSSAAMNTHK